jgi:hypothetical protein
LEQIIKFSSPTDYPALDKTYLEYPLNPLLTLFS